MKRRISTILISSGTILLLLGMLLSTVSFAAGPASPLPVAKICLGCATHEIHPGADGGCGEVEEGLVVTAVAIKAGAGCFLESVPGCYTITFSGRDWCATREGSGSNCQEISHVELCTEPADLCEGVTCNDNNACTDDSCDPATGNCVYTPNDAHCDEDGWVDTDDTRWVDTGPCTEEEQKKQEYRDYYCHETEGCKYDVTDTQWVDTGNTRNKPVSTECEADGDLCTIDHCDGAGACVTYDNVPVPDDTVCASYECNSETGQVDVTYAPLSTTCEVDGDLCTIDHCDGAGTCVTYDEVTCDDLVDGVAPDQCGPQGWCNPATGQCEYGYPPLSTTCEADGDLCTIDHCDGAGTCVTYDNVPVPDDTICASYECNSETGQVDVTYAPLSTTCEVDGDLCTIDHCDGAGTCVTYDNVICEDIYFCSAEVCDPDLGCVEGEPDVSCDDENICTDDTCDEDNDVCVNVFDVTNDPSCQACYGVVCDDGDICTDDYCDAATGQCVYQFDASNDPSCRKTCEDATITVQVTQCGAGVVGASVELHSSGGNKYGPATTNAAGQATFSVIGGTNNLWYAIVNGARMGATIKVTECGGAGSINVTLSCPPTPTVVEVLGVERLPTTGEMPLAPVLPSLPMILSSLTLIGSGLLLRRKE